MIRRLIILLLIVGCDNSTEPEPTCELCEVAWVHYVGETANNGKMHWTDGYKPIVVSPGYPEVVYPYYVIIHGDTLKEPLSFSYAYPYNSGLDSVRSITHFVSQNLFEIIDDNGSEKTLLLEEYEIFDYRYK